MRGFIDEGGGFKFHPIHLRQFTTSTNAFALADTGGASMFPPQSLRQHSACESLAIGDGVRGMELCFKCLVARYRVACLDHLAVSL